MLTRSLAEKLIRAVLALSVAIPLFASPAFASSLLEEIKRPTGYQQLCRDRAPRTPQRVAFGFSGWLSYLVSYGMIRDMLGTQQRSDVDFHYHAFDSVDPNALTDVARCAYELATKPYKNAHGKIVFNTLIIVGHSFGGTSAYQLATILGKLGVNVDLVITADPRQLADQDGSFKIRWEKPENVARWLNFYEKNDPIFPGYIVPGAENIQVGGMHLTVPNSAAAWVSNASAGKVIPTFRQDFRNSFFDEHAIPIRVVRQQKKIKAPAKIKAKD